MQGTSLTKQERECKLYDEFNKFTCKKGESLHEYYMRFTLLLNDMNIFKMSLEQFQVNTKFLNTLPTEWSKFIIDVNLVKDLHTTNVDQIHAHLEQHERHAKKNLSNPEATSHHNDRRIAGKQNQYRDKFPLKMRVLQELSLRRQVGVNSGKQGLITMLQIAKGMDHMSNNSLTKKKLMIHDALAEVHNHDNVKNNMINQVVQVMLSSKLSNVVNYSETKITSDSNIIPYSQYLIESQQQTVQNSNSFAQQDVLILSVIEQLKTQVATCTKINLENKSVNDTLTAELERYKE
ncbi:hypothetical protein Tco_0408788 [Tanacetum coccineum]